jgi:hypothetical protein
MVRFGMFWERLKNTWKVKRFLRIVVNCHFYVVKTQLAVCEMYFVDYLGISWLLKIIRPMTVWWILKKDLNFAAKALLTRTLYENEKN